MNETTYDLVVIGGGINGCGIALDVQGRGLSTALIEKGDIASATSSASSKLIHGGLRYLEHYEFRLVRESLNEREVLLKKAPHLIKPLRFIMPHREHLRSSWLIRIGLWLYDVLGKRDILPPSKFLKFDPQTSDLDPEITKGYEYSDCWVDDARLATLNAVQFQEKGGVVKTYTKCTSAVIKDGIWHLTLKDTLSGGVSTLKARGLVNAAGPWAESFFKESLTIKSPYGVKLIKGSHIVVPKISEGDKAYILQNADRRIVFVIPYLGDFSLVGTTDVIHKGDPKDAKISEDEVTYLCNIVNEHFKKKITPEDVVWDYSGVRALCDDESESPQALTRDYTLDVESIDGTPLLSVFGGKLTTYRKLSEHAADKLEEFYPKMSDPWTESGLLPGSEDFPGVDIFQKQLSARYGFLSSKTVQRFTVSYGSRSWQVLGEASCIEDLGINFGEEFTQAEVDYLIREEFVKTAEDALWRRSKMGIFLSQDQRQAVADYVAGLQQNAATGS